jgi:hypothetical protein
MVVSGGKICFSDETRKLKKSICSPNINNLVWGRMGRQDLNRFISVQNIYIMPKLIIH